MFYQMKNVQRYASSFLRVLKMFDDLRYIEIWFTLQWVLQKQLLHFYLDNMLQSLGQTSSGVLPSITSMQRS